MDTPVLILGLIFLAMGLWGMAFPPKPSGLLPWGLHGRFAAGVSLGIGVAFVAGSLMYTT